MSKSTTQVTPEMVAYAEQYHAAQLAYNGWPNYETWRVNLELISDYADSLQKDGERFKSTSDMADSFKEYVESVIDEYPDGLAKDYANAFIESVKWFTIAQHYDELIQEEDEEV